MERIRHRCPVPDLGLSYDVTLSNVSVLYYSATHAQDTSVLSLHSVLAVTPRGCLPGCLPPTGAKLHVDVYTHFGETQKLALYTSKALVPVRRDSICKWEDSAYS